MKVLFVLASLLMSVTAKADILLPHTTAEFAETSVKVVRHDEQGGGTGVILTSTSARSFVLTNRHVCQMLDPGSKVVTLHASYPVTAFKASRKHDLCLVLVDGDLHVNTKLAEHEPDIFSKAFISGHPHLLPHVLSKGDFSDKLTVNIMVGSRPCNQKEMKENVPQCIFFGMPITEKFEAQLVSGLILPGNSGSAVFNEQGEICAVVFASDGPTLSYAMVVPYLYVRNFLRLESKLMTWTVPKVEKKPEPAPKQTKSVKIFIEPMYIPNPSIKTTDK